VSLQGKNSLFQAVAQWMNIQLMVAELAPEQVETPSPESQLQAQPQPESTSHSPPSEAAAPQTSTPQPATAPSRSLRKRKKSKHDRFLETSATHKEKGDACVTVHGKGGRQWHRMPDDFRLGDSKTGLWVGAGDSIGVGDERTMIVVSVGKGGDANPNAHWKGILYDPKANKCSPKALDWVKHQVPLLCVSFNVCQGRNLFWEWRERPTVNEARMQEAYKEFLANVLDKITVFVARVLSRPWVAGWTRGGNERRSGRCRDSG
jgi:hypothetical protein